VIQPAIQVAPSCEGSAYGLLIQDPEGSTAKRGALTFDPVTGLEKTTVSLALDDGTVISPPSRVGPLCGRLKTAAPERHAQVA